jgi:hypothetical protein
MKCLICDCDIKNRQQLAYHLNTAHHINTHDYNIKYKPNKDNNLLECPICGQYNLKQLTHHLTWKHKLTKDEFLKQYPNTTLWIDEISERCSKAQSIGIKTFKQNLVKNPHYYDEMFKRRSAHRDYKSIAIKINNTRLKRGTNLKTSIQSKKLWENEQYRKLQSDKTKNQHKNGLTEIIMQNSGKRRYPITLGGITYKMRSTWETKLAQYFFEHDIEFKYEAITLKYEYNDKIKQYYPDFYLTTNNVIVEVKPAALCVDEQVVAKKLACEAKGYKFMFITENELSDLDAVKFE